MRQTALLPSQPHPPRSTDEYNDSMKMKGWVLRIASLVLLLVICGVAALGLSTRRSGGVTGHREKLGNIF